MLCNAGSSPQHRLLHLAAAGHGDQGAAGQVQGADYARVHGVQGQDVSLRLSFCQLPLSGAVLRVCTIFFHSQAYILTGSDEILKMLDFCCRYAASFSQDTEELESVQSLVFGNPVKDIEVQVGA